MSQSDIIGVLSDLSRELRDLDLGGRVQRAPIERVSPLQFLRDYVASSKPLVITGAIDHWPALGAWTPSRLATSADGAHVTVALTPNGLADAPARLPGGAPAFVLPHQQRMPLEDFFLMLGRSRRREPGAWVPYCQAQNSSLTTELPALLADLDTELPWASEAFGAQPEAVNLWLGGDRSATSWHRDHYENIYAVVAGCKAFTLLPPTDAYRLRLRRYPVATYAPTAAAAAGGGSAEAAHQLEAVLHDPPEEILWSSILPEPLRRDSSQGVGPERGGGGERRLLDDPSLPPPLRVTVRAGEVLYLPACWWHQVQQHAEPSEGEGGAPGGGSRSLQDEDGGGGVDFVDPGEGDDDLGLVVAVNYWYDMKMNAGYAFAKAAEALAAAAGLNDAPPPDDHADSE